MTSHTLTSPFVLYSSEGCHLCEMALALCHQQIDKTQLRIVDIVEDDALVEQYGVHIPVLEKISDGTKLFWPFNSQQLAAFI